MRDIITLMLNLCCHGNTYGNVHSTILILRIIFFKIIQCSHSKSHKVNNCGGLGSVI